MTTRWPKNLRSDMLLARLGLERRRSGLARALPILAGLGLGALASAGLIAAARTERGKKLRENVSKRITRRRTDRASAPAGASGSASRELHASA